MKRLLLAAVMVLVTLVGMVGFSRAQTLSAISAASGPNVFPPYPNKEEDEIARTEALARANAVSELQAAVNAGASANAKMYYLTVFSFTGDDAITACDSGFHMASISEIQDPSSLQYADRSTAAYDKLVDGQRLGPPSNHMGWVRTGSFLPAGVPDYCDFSMSSFDQQSGTTVSFHSPVLGDSYMDPSPSDPTTTWQMAQLSFSLPEPVWCVEDPE